MIKDYVFVGKCLFFPKERILVIGDLHLGYEESLKARGLEMPLGQFEEMKKELLNVFTFVKAKYGKIEKIVVLGDVKHSFGFIYSEKKYMLELIRFLRKYVNNENRIIFIRGNHERNDKNEKFVDYFIEKDIAFIHGNRELLEIFDKSVNLVVMGHLHPTITLRDKMKIKNEKYKCFLTGEFRAKKFIVVPSFLNITEGVSSEEFSDDGRDFSIIPQKELRDFEVFVCQDIGEEALDFGKLKDIN